MKKIYSNRNLSDLEAERVKKYEYKYEEVKFDIAVFRFEMKDHSTIIDRYAKQGWRYVGWIPLKCANDGRAFLSLHLIFEKEINE